MRKNLEAISVGALALLLWITFSALYCPNPLPQHIPTHFDMAGNPNGWGSSTMLLFFPAVAVGVYLLVTLVAQFPAVFNYPVRVTPENRARLQDLTLSMIAWMKVEMVCLFTWIQWAIVEAVRNGHGSFSPLVVPVWLMVFFATMGWFFVAMWRVNQGGSGS